MMTAKQLRETLANVPDDTIIVVSGPSFRNYETIGSQLVRNFSGSPFDGKSVFFIDVAPSH